MKFSNNSNFGELSRKHSWSIVYEVLTIEELELYAQIFDEDPDPPMEVEKELKELLSKFVSLGFHKNSKYPDFIELSYKAIEEDYDMIEKDKLHVINHTQDEEVICRHKDSGEWNFVASVSKELILEFYRNKNKYSSPSLSFKFNTNTGTISSGSIDASGASGGGGGDFFSHWV